MLRGWLLASAWVGGLLVAALLDAPAARWTVAVVGAAAWLALGRHRAGSRAATAPPAAASPASPTGPDDVLAATLAAVEDGILVLDREDRVLAANAAARKLTGLPDAAASPRNLHEVVDWPQLTAAVRACRRDGSANSFEAARGEADAALTVGVAIRIRDLDGLAIVVLHDLSRLRRLESHRRDFVANVSHELKTPLAAIQGFVETLLDDPDVPPATRQRFLERVLKQAHNLATLVSDLLTLSRLDERGPELADPCDLVAVLGEVVRDLQPFADKRGVVLTCTTPHNHIWVVAEREALRQVIANLVDNAIKYTPTAGMVAVGVRRDGQFAEIEVRDTGIGLSEPDQQRVFERFYRVDKARSRELGGTGLGLSIVKNIVQGLGGTIGVRSRLGVGSTFWVRLPAEVHDD